MNILLCLNKDIYSCVALNYLAESLKGDNVKICFSDGVGSPTNAPQLEQLLFWERKSICVNFR